MPRTLYTPRLSDEVVRLLYREGQRRQMPMTRLADDLIRESLGAGPTGLHVMDDVPATQSLSMVRDSDDRPAA